MKNKFILCLALVLSGGLFGCSTTIQGNSKTELASIQHMGLVKRAQRDFNTKLPDAKIERFRINYIASTNVVWCTVDYRYFGKKDILQKEFAYGYNGGTNWILVWNIDLPICYHNTQYDLTFYLPESWKGYSVMTNEWDGEHYSSVLDETIFTEHGQEIVLRHPQWKTNDIYLDIPIIVFTHKQWREEEQGKIWPNLYAGGVIDEMWHNRKYVFAISSRYAAADDVKGWQEGQDIVNKNSAAHPELQLYDK